MVVVKSKLSATISALGSDDPGVGQWAIIEQKDVPEEQQIATAEDFYAGIAQLESGHSAHTAFSQTCPVKYGSASGQRTVNYDLKFYVHRSEGLEYDLEVTLGGELLEHNGPAQGILTRGKPWIFDNNKTQFLGWRPYQGIFRSYWEIAFDSSARPATNPPEIEQSNGYIYLIGDPVVGSLWVGGKADVDTYTVKVGQAVGTSWQGNLFATVYWPSGAPREDQQSVTEELFLPECVIEKIEDCAATGGQQQDDDEDGNIDYDLAPVYLDVDDCSGEVIGKTPNQS